MIPLAPLVPSITGTPSGSLSVNPRSDGAISHAETEISQLNPDRSMILHSGESHSDFILALGKDSKI